MGWDKQWQVRCGEVEESEYTTVIKESTIVNETEIQTSRNKLKQYSKLQTRFYRPGYKVADKYVITIKRIFGCVGSE